MPPKYLDFFILIFDILVLFDEYCAIECYFCITLFAFFPLKEPQWNLNKISLETSLDFDENPFKLFIYLYIECKFWKYNSWIEYSYYILHTCKFSRR